MTKVVVRNPFPIIDRDSFLTPFDKMFDEIVGKSFPEINQQVGVNPFQGTAYPKVNVYEYDDKVGIVAEIPGLDKKQLNIEVEEGVVEKLDDFIKWCYYENLFYKDERLGGYCPDPSWVYRLPTILMSYARPISKGFGLYPYNQEQLKVGPLSI